MSDLVDRARDALKSVVDPEAGLNIVDLGLVYDVAIENGRLVALITFTTEACPVGPRLAAEAERALAAVAGAAPVEIRVTFDPPWTPERITPDGRALLGR
ncbi:MAG: metal-sulfur cluster assembly factor [Alphaproteobacteria bacterium]